MSKIQEHVNIKQFTTFGVDCIANKLISFSSIEELKLNLPGVKDNFLVLGGGSNILFTQDFSGTIYKNEIKGKNIVFENTEEIYLEVGAGENWHEFVLYAVENNWGGIENLSLIPGCVGASPIQNIGAYGVEIKDVFKSVKFYDLESKEILVYDKDKCKFGYRDSIFKQEKKGKIIILSVTYALTKKHILKTGYGAIKEELSKLNKLEFTIQDVSNAVINIRNSKLPNPKEIGNGGSFFKNPIVKTAVLNNIKKKFDTVPAYPVNDDLVKIPAGWLIEQAGWKGKTLGNYGVHKNQALVLVNYSNAKGNDIYQLSTQIIADIKSKFDIELEREVNII